MTDWRKSWRAGYLLIVMIFTVPGALMLLRHWGYVPDGTATPAMPVSNRSVMAPDFALRDLDGNIRHLSSFRGQVVLLTFWAAWCTPCRTEMPLMEALYQAYQDYGFEVVAIASDVQGDEVVQPFVTQHQLSFTTLLDAAGQTTHLYGVTSLPTSYLLDRAGRLVTVAIGKHDWTQGKARALIMSVLNSAPPATVRHDAGATRETSSTATQRSAGRP
jgi:peroxiredoxin